MNGKPESDVTEIPHFRDIVGDDPWPWQRKFYASLVAGDAPDAVDIPTGLGKTACVLLALLARVRNRALPTRIVYVVDRRAIVDQTAGVVAEWVERIAALPTLAGAFDACAAFPAERPVAIGVLRGGLADDGAWRADPARPTVIVGTVDMVGSRLLFAGYGDGRSRRALHAGLLGHDALVLLDEAHLAPAMTSLLGAVAALQRKSEFRAIALSAVGARSGAVRGLGREDLACAAVRRRLRARKSLRLSPVTTPSARIARLCDAALAHETGAVAVFVEHVADAARIAARLARALGPGGAQRVALLTGTLRAFERAALTAGAVWQRFRPRPSRPRDGASVYLVATAAGEVGVDLDADHAVMDLSTLDSMVQRIGRTNRTGTGAATVTVVFAASDAEAPAASPTSHRQLRQAARQRTLAVLRDLPDVSPMTLHAIDRDTLDACTVESVEPARLDATVVEAFASTSAGLALPSVDVYLRGVRETPERPETHLLWRWDVAALAEVGTHAAAEALAFFPPAARELARVPSRWAEALVRRALARRAGRGLPVVVAGRDGTVFASVVDDEAALPSLEYATVVLHPDAGGLSPAGLPDEAAADEVDDVGDDADRIRYMATCDAKTIETDARVFPEWLNTAVERRIAVAPDGCERSLVYARRRRAPRGERGRGALAARTPTVDAHCARVAAAARRIATALRLPASLIDALEAAGRCHDRGKTRAVWQRAAGAPPGSPPLAKSWPGRLRGEWLDGYRHEFGSLVDAERALGPGAPHRDLILHLVAAHHGWARPGFPHRAQWDPDEPARANEARAMRVAHRFARLQAHYGPWRLAWLESLLKAADAWVSSETYG